MLLTRFFTSTLTPLQFILTCRPHMHTHTHTPIHIHTCIHTHVHMPKHIHTCMCTHLYTHIHTHADTEFQHLWPPPIAIRINTKILAMACKSLPALASAYFSCLPSHHSPFNLSAPVMLAFFQSLDWNALCTLPPQRLCTCYFFCREHIFPTLNSGVFLIEAQISFPRGTLP